MHGVCRIFAVVLPVMACRMLTIHFCEDGDVKYDFCRTHGQTLLYRYLIEWPSEKVVCPRQEAFRIHNFRMSVTEKNYVLLEWDKVRENQTHSERNFYYYKKDKLSRVDKEPFLWRYTERIKIKPNFYLRLHTPFDRINALSQLSHATFQSASGQIRKFRPRELANIQFSDEPGVLTIDWTLETLYEPNRFVVQ